MVISFIGFVSFIGHIGWDEKVKKVQKSRVLLTNARIFLTFDVKQALSNEIHCALKV